MDVCLKITNAILIIIAVLSLGVVIGNHYYNHNVYMSCDYIGLSHETDNFQK